MKKWITMFLVAAMLLTMFTACGAKSEPAKEPESAAQTETAKEPEDSGSENTSDAEPFKVAWLHNASDQWHHQCAVIGKQRMEEECENVEVTLFDHKNESATIMSILEQLIMEGDWGLCIYSTMTDDTEIVRQLQDTGCNVICYAIEWDWFDGVISTFVCSEYDLGYLAASVAAEQLPENANVVVLRGAEGYSGSILRGQGFADALANRPDITILDEKFQSFDKSKAMTQMEDWITAYGDEIDGVLSENDGMALGAIEALNAAGMDVEGMVITGIDGLYEGCVAIKEGILDVSAYQSADLYADAFIARIKALQSGEVDAYCCEDLILDAMKVDQSNVDELLANYEALGMAQ